MKKKFIAIFLVLTMTVCAFPVSGFAENLAGTLAIGDSGYINGTSVYLRSSASTSNTPLSKVYKPDTVSVLGNASGSGYNWYYVRMTGGGSFASVGYVAQQYVTIGSTTKSWKIVAQSGANLRSGPGTNYRSDGLLSLGTTFYIMDDVWNSADGYTWYKIMVTSGSYRGYWGYVRNAEDIVDYY